MRYYIILFFSVLSFFCACNRTGVPDDIIPPDQMTGLLTQIYLVDGGLYNVSQFPDTLYKYGTARYLAVFKKFDVDSAAFRKSCIYYSANEPQKLLDMNTKILAALQVKSDSLTTLITKRQLKTNANNVPSPALNHAFIAHPGPVTTGKSNPPAAVTAHPVSTFHPGSGGGTVVQQPATVLSQGKVVPANSYMSPMVRFKANRARMIARSDSIKKARQHH